MLSLGDERSAVSDAMRPIGVGGLALFHRPRSKSPRSSPASSGRGWFSGKLPSPRIISATSCRALIEPTVIVGFSRQFLRPSREIASVPNSLPNIYVGTDGMHRPPAPAGGAR